MAFPFDVETGDDYSEDLKSPEWKTEAAVLKALKNLGHEPRLLGLHASIEPLQRAIASFNPDLVFNLCEALRGDRAFEAHLPALLELLGVPFTGASFTNLSWCKDKGGTKKILEAEGICVPRSQVARRARGGFRKKIGELAFPLLIKPVGLESSSGIAQNSLVFDAKSAVARIEFVHSKLDQDALVEEFIAGRELYVSVLCGGAKGVEIYPPRELFFDEYPEGEPRFATYKAKWDDAYRKKWGIRTGPAKVLDDVLWKRIQDDCRKICETLSLKGYARMDLRLDVAGVPRFLEVNPNPSLAIDDDFPRSARHAGYSYDQLIERIIELAGR